jgi:hypothetical protein
MLSSSGTLLGPILGASDILDARRGLKDWYRRLGLIAGGGMDTLARPTSPSVASVSACWLFSVEGVLESSLIEDCDRDDSPDVVRERGSKFVAIIGSSD